MMMNEHRYVHDLIAPYVLRAVTPEEEAAVEQHMAHCVECQALAGEFREVEMRLPDLVGEESPPPALKTRLMSIVQAEAAPGTIGAPHLQAVGGATLSPRRGRDTAPVPRPLPLRRFGHRLTPLLAAAALFAVAALGWSLWTLRGGPGQQPTRVYAMSGTPALPTIRGTLSYYQDGRRLDVVLHGLKPIPGNRVYELWLIRGTSVVKGVRAFRPDSAGSARVTLNGETVPAYTLAGLTVEHGPISTVPHKPIVATAQLG